MKSKNNNSCQYSTCLIVGPEKEIEQKQEDKQQTTLDKILKGMFLK